MISVPEAQQLIIQHAEIFSSSTIPLHKAWGQTLAKDVFAPIAIPPFNQSAVDGYAFAFKNLDTSYHICGEIPAGTTHKMTPQPHEAVRIFTGAMVPNTCDTVIMQEFTNVENQQLFIEDKGLKKGANIRKKGYQIAEKDLALAKGTILNAGAIGFLATLGFTNIEVAQLPSISIIITGNELVKPGQKLAEGQIYESNSLMLQAAFQSLHISPSIIFVKDNADATFQAISKAIQQSDIVVLSGGISVGDYDFVKQGLEANGVKEIFYKVAQKPGKPLFFGKKGTKAIFGLPGNPAAALTCFYEYIFPYIKKGLGCPSPFLITLRLPLSKSIQQKPGRAVFMKAFTDFNTVTPLEGQNSDALQSFARANAFILTPAEAATIEEGALITVHLLPKT